MHQNGADESGTENGNIGRKRDLEAIRCNNVSNECNHEHLEAEDEERGMVGVVNLNHLKIKLLNNLPIECLESHSVGIVSQAKVLFFGDDILKEFFLDSQALLFLLLLLLKLLGVLALDELKDGGLFMLILSRSCWSTRLGTCIV